MIIQRKWNAVAVWASMALAAGFAQKSAAAAQSARDSYQSYSSGIEVMTRGAVHEAFGGPINYNPEPGRVVSARPPRQINEYPPYDRPDDPDCIWIPGYWSWDDDMEDYVWISGMWRIPPPDTVWVAGYSARTDEGYQWAPGFWQSNYAEDIQYYSPPPPSLERGPEGRPPTRDAIWAPGCWRAGYETWRWETGRWIRPVPDWVWVPSHWLWTPGGCVFVEGYWDLLPSQRGMVFAPVHYRRPVYSTSNYSYSPSIVIQIEALLGNLFSRPRHSEYYFGDYYGSSSDYDRRGIYPWYECSRTQNGWYDSIYTYEGWQHRSDESSWRDSERSQYEYRRDHRDARPTRTYTGDADYSRGAPDSRRTNIVMAQSLTQIINNQSRNNDGVNADTHRENFRISKVDPETKNQIDRKDKELRQLRDDRSNWETQAPKANGARDSKNRERAIPMAKPLPIKPIVPSFVQTRPAAAETRAPLAQEGENRGDRRGRATPAATPAQNAQNSANRTGRGAPTVAPAEEEKNRTDRTGSPAPAAKRSRNRPPARPDVIKLGPSPKGVPTVAPNSTPQPSPTPKATPAPTPRGRGRGRNG